MKLLIPIFLVLLASCGRPESHPQTASSVAPIGVHTITAGTAEWPDIYEATGAVHARSTAALSAKIVAQIQEVTVNPGDRVRAGQTLITLDARDLEAGVRRAEAARAEAQNAVPEADHAIAGARAQLDLAQATFRRIDDLATKKSVSPHELDEATARLKAAQSAHEAARSRRAQLDSRLAQVDQEIRSASIARDYARITAPFDGIVTSKIAEPGMMAAPGASLVTIERDSGYRFETGVEESRLGGIRTGQSVPVTIDALDRTLTARVSEIVPSVDAASRTYTVKLDMPPTPNLRSGVFGRAAFPLAVRPVLAIPVEAIVERGQLQQVFVVENGHVRLRMVTTARRRDQTVEILSGLAAGEKLISPIPAGLADGARVEVRP